jgi:hypothetical protein
MSDKAQIQNDAESTREQVQESLEILQRTHSDIFHKEQSWHQELSKSASVGNGGGLVASLAYLPNSPSIDLTFMVSLWAFTIGILFAVFQRGLEHATSSAHRKALDVHTKILRQYETIMRRIENGEARKVDKKSVGEIIKGGYPSIWAMKIRLYLSPFVLYASILSFIIGLCSGVWSLTTLYYL